MNDDLFEKSLVQRKAMLGAEYVEKTWQTSPARSRKR